MQHGVRRVSAGVISVPFFNNKLQEQSRFSSKLYPPKSLTVLEKSHYTQITAFTLCKTQESVLKHYRFSLFILIQQGTT